MKTTTKYCFLSASTALAILALGAAPQAFAASSAPSIIYDTQVQRIGWQHDPNDRSSWFHDGQEAGTNGRSLRMESIKIALKLPSGMTGGVSYDAHVQNIGWQNAANPYRQYAPIQTIKPLSQWFANGATAGTVGKGLRMEAFTIQLTGEIAQHYDVKYDSHVQNYGWQYASKGLYFQAPNFETMAPVSDWFKNGQEVGTNDRSLRMEALAIKLVAKPTSTTTKNVTVNKDDKGNTLTSTSGYTKISSSTKTSTTSNVYGDKTITNTTTVVWHKPVETAVTTREAAIAELNALRATKGRHDTLTKGDGAPRPAVREDAEMDKWAQTRANELAKNDSGLSHADDSNGEPAWNKLVDMTKTFPDPASLHGPECLAMRWGAGLNYGQALQMWWDEYKNPNAGVGHYLTMVNPSYNVAGIGIATSKDGTHYAVLEMADKHPAVQGNTIKPIYTRTINAVDTKGKVIKTLFKQTLTATATLNLTTQKYSWDKQSLTLKGYNDSDFPTIPGYTYIREQGDVDTTTFNPADDPFGDDYGGEGTAIYEANSLVPTLSLNQTVNGQSSTYFYKFTAPKDGWYVLKYTSDTAATGVPSILKTPSISSGINNELSPYGGVTSGRNYMNPVELSAGQTVYVWTGPRPSKDTLAMATPTISKYITVNEVGVGGPVLSNTNGYTKDYSYTEVTASKGTNGSIVLTQTTYNCWFKNSY